MRSLNSVTAVAMFSGRPGPVGLHPANLMLHRNRPVVHYTKSLEKSVKAPWNLQHLLAVMATCGLFSSTVFGGESGTPVQLKVDKPAHQVQINIEGKHFATYNYGEDLPKPYMSPVKAADGTVLTRPIIDPKVKDHPHHKGIWVAIDEVNDIKFWAEKGKIRNKSVKATSGDPGKLVTVNEWLGEDGKPVVTESTTISIYPNRLLTYEIQFIAGDEEVTFDDTKEGLFGYRMASSMRESEGGKVVNADGAKGTGEAWGKPSAWVDYYGTVEGETHGIALFDHPDNFRPSRYHVRNYGLFSISPFGEAAYSKGKSKAAPLTLEPGKSFTLRYAAYLHEGDTKTGKVAEAYQQFVKAVK